MNHLQWLHLLEGGLRGVGGVGDASRQLARWADWLVPPPPPTSGSATAAGTAEERVEDDDGGSDVREDLRLLQARDAGANDSSGASIAGDTTYGVGVYVDIPDCADLSAGDGNAVAAADTRETAETAINSPRSAESSSSSSTPSWVMATGSTDSSSASSAPSAFEVTSLLDEDDRPPAPPDMVTTTAPPSSPTRPHFGAAASVESASSSNNGDGADGATGPRNSVGPGDEASRREHVSPSSASHRVLAAIVRELELAEEAVEGARQTLLDQGFSQPSRGHMLQVLLRNAKKNKGHRERAEDPGEADNDAGRPRMKGCDGSVPTTSVFLASAALSIMGDASSLGASNASQNLADSATTAAGVDPAPQRGSGDELDEGESWFGAVDGDKEAVGSWGFRDSGFCLESDRADGGDPYVVMRGNRSVLNS